MGHLFSKLHSLFQEWSSAEPSRLLLLGLDAAGKTTVLYKVKLNETVSTIPTIGFNVETVSPMKGLNFTVWDVGGQEKIRPLWRHYFQNTQGLLFVVDSSDTARIPEAREELYGVLEADEMRNVPVVIMANKQDLPHAMSPSQLVDALELPKLGARGHKWHIQATCATVGEGIYESLHQMAQFVKEVKRGR